MSESSRVEPRRVSQIATAMFLPSSPWPTVRLRGSRAKGISYEKMVGRWLREWAKTLPGVTLHSGQWLKFQDSSGPGHAQPDHYLVFPSLVLLIECKLKQNTCAEGQLLHLYRPLLEHLYARPVFTIQVFRHWRFRPNRFEIKHPAELVAYPRDGVFMWHFMGE